jgi:hypothetical protein
LMCIEINLRRAHRLMSIGQIGTFRTGLIGHACAIHLYASNNGRFFEGVLA